MRANIKSWVGGLLCVGAAVGCGVGTDEGAAAPDEAALSAAVPSIEHALDRSFPAGAGLLPGEAPWGWPVREGENMNPAILEARRFYDTLKSPRAAMGIANETAPLTFESWKQAFGFSPRAPGESLEDFRARTGVVVYYNK